jgi:REP element-mobilizing transposase RayT
VFKENLRWGMHKMPERKLNRLAGYDYSTPGSYFITICVKNRDSVFGEIKNSIMILNEFGKIIDQQWNWLFNQYDYIEKDEYIIMPNHFHGIIQIAGIVGNGRDRSLRQPNRKIKPIPELIGALKTTSSKLIHHAGFDNFQWQKSYHDRIIRNDDELNRVRIYIIDNPKNWKKNEEFAVSEQYSVTRQRGN